MSCQLLKIWSKKRSNWIPREPLLYSPIDFQMKPNHDLVVSRIRYTSMNERVPNKILKSNMVSNQMWIRQSTSDSIRILTAYEGLVHEEGVLKYSRVNSPTSKSEVNGHILYYNLMQLANFMVVIILVIREKQHWVNGRNEINIYPSTWLTRNWVNTHT